MNKCSSYRKALFHAAGESPHTVVLPVAQTNLFEKVIYTCVEVRCAVHPPEETEVFSCCEFVIEIGLMRNNSDLLPNLDRILFYVNTVDYHPAVIRGYKGGQYFNKGRLSCAIRSEYRKEFALLYLKVDVTQDYVGTERFREVFNRYYMNFSFFCLNGAIQVLYFSLPSIVPYETKVVSLKNM